MKPDDREQILIQLAERDDPAFDANSTPEAVSDTLLTAFVEGALDAAERRRVEALLVRSPVARRRLESMAGKLPVEAPSDIRQALVHRFGRQRENRSRRRVRWRSLAAALVAVVAGGIFLWPAPLPPAYDVGISGLEALRRRHEIGPSMTDADATESRVATALRDTRVTVTAVVRGRAERDVDVALYRMRGDVVERFPEGPGVVREERRGVVVLHARAADLVGDAPGTYQLFLVLARNADLPSTLEIPRLLGDDSDEIVDDGRRWHRLVLHLRNPIAPQGDWRSKTREEEVHETTYRLRTDLSFVHLRAGVRIREADRRSAASG